MAQAIRSVQNVAKARILAIPLTSHSHLTGQYTYYHFQTPPSSGEKEEKSSFANWAIGKAVKAWADFGKAPEGSFKYKTFKYGERLIDRIDFEELALRSMDVTLWPDLTKLGRRPLQLDEKGIDHAKISLIYPSSFAQRISALDHLQSLLKVRTPKHRRGALLWLSTIPFTAPLKLIPIIPNLPFFFCAWRTWHHYRAYKASSYLQDVIKYDLINPEGSSDLDRIYSNFAPFSLAEGNSASTAKPCLLKAEAIPHIISLFGLPSSAERDLLRALEQTKLRVLKSSK